MITAKEFPNRTFKDLNELFEALKENEARLITLKCAQIYKSIDKLDGFKVTPFLNKSFTGAEKAEPWMKSGHLYPIINTTKYYDSHSDVHFNGLWSRTIKANVGKLHYVEAHSLKIADIIAWPESVTAFTKIIPWSMVGKNYPGDTEALIYEIPKEAIAHPGALQVISQKRDMQNSVRMQYVKLALALNSDSKEWKENKELYDERIDLIANKEEVAENGYFWAVDEAKIFKEGSMVIAGSNDATAIQYGDDGSAKRHTEDPGPGTRHSEKEEDEAQFFKNLI